MVIEFVMVPKTKSVSASSEKVMNPFHPQAEFVQISAFSYEGHVTD